MTKRLLIKIEYDGGPFVGWQRQKEGLSVQGAIEDAATAFINNPVQIAGAGRTDSGVHALGQMAHLDVPEKFTTNRVVEALNSHLYNLPITIRSAVQVPKDFHARFQAIRRCYLYRILPRRQPPALNKERVWHHKQSLDASLMIKAAKFLTGKHDFSSFRSSSCQAESPVKTLDRLEVIKVDEEIHIHAEAKSFLHHQIRNIAGTLSFVGSGKWKPSKVKDVLLAADRGIAGPKAPAKGLYLVSVHYPPMPPVID